MIDEHIDEILDELERYKKALEKISNMVVSDGDYESAYWDMILEADQVLYDDEGKDN